MEIQLEGQIMIINFDKYTKARCSSCSVMITRDLDLREDRYNWCHMCGLITRIGSE
jgi:hypothetical protein